MYICNECGKTFQEAAGNYCNDCKKESIVFDENLVAYDGMSGEAAPELTAEDKPGNAMTLIRFLATMLVGLLLRYKLLRGIDLL